MDSVNPEADGCTVNVEAIGLDSMATGHMLQSLEQTLVQEIDELNQRLLQLEEGVAQQSFSGYQGNRKRLPNQLLPMEGPNKSCDSLPLYEGGALCLGLRPVLLIKAGKLETPFADGQAG